jgi:glycosyltransferase involved in cell wall biosynthesis
LHLPASTLIGTFLARLLTDKPVFVTIYTAKHQMRWPAYNAFRLIAPLVSKIITVLPVSRADLTSIGVSDDKIVFVPMGLDFAGANPFRHDEVRHALGATYGFDPQRPLLLSVARLARDRHIHLLVDAMTYISKTRPNALLLMVGDGNQRANLERSVERRGLQRNIIFGKPRLDVWNVMPGCDVYLTMASGHGAGIAALQAMACARPVAAYNMGAMQAEHELQTGQGMFIAARDAHALARVRQPC